jgi:hypothetical protein
MATWRIRSGIVGLPSAALAVVGFRLHVPALGVTPLAVFLVGVFGCQVMSFVEFARMCVFR